MRVKAALNVTEEAAEELGEDRCPGCLLSEPRAWHLLHTVHKLSLSLTFFADGIGSLFGFVLHVLHHTVYLGLMLQEDRTDDAPVEQLSPISWAGCHAPQQEATLQGTKGW